MFIDGSFRFVCKAVRVHAERKQVVVRAAGPHPQLPSVPVVSHVDCGFIDLLDAKRVFVEGFRAAAGSGVYDREQLGAYSNVLRNGRERPSVCLSGRRDGGGYDGPKRLEEPGNEHVVWPVLPSVDHEQLGRAMGGEDRLGALNESAVAAGVRVQRALHDSQQRHTALRAAAVPQAPCPGRDFFRGSCC